MSDKGAERALKKSYVKYGVRPGKEAFGKANEKVKTAPKDDERAEKNFFLSIAFTPESEEKIKHVCDRIDTIAKKHGIPLVLAGRDARAHATLKGGALETDDVEARKRAYGEIYFNETVLQEKEKLAGVAIDFRFVVTNPDSITLTSVSIPDEITEFRAHVKEAAESQGVSMPNRPDIMHITLARPTALPEEGREQKLKGFLEDMLALRREISKGPPITLVVDHVFTAPVKRYKKA